MFGKNKENKVIEENLVKLKMLKQSVMMGVEQNKTKGFQEVTAKVYDIAFCNGIENAIALFEGREPEYIQFGEDEDEERTGRTKASGVLKH